jgi:hypothetical protein
MSGAVAGFRRFATRTTPDRLILRRGHELPETDEVVSRVNGYLVVERAAAAA